MGFSKAKAMQAALKFGIYGPAGSGKSLTSLLLAEGLAKLTKKRIAYVDTERGSDFYATAVATRTVHPEAFDFDALYTRSLMDTLTEIRNLNPEEHGVVIVDSVTHLWEAARLAYEGRTTKIGTIPLYAWSAIKKPYKDLMAVLLSSPMHVFICGRQGNEFAEGEDGELKLIGRKMKAEGETAYEPHVLLRMEPIKQPKGEAIITAFAEKDRTSVLAGKTFQLWPGTAKTAFDLLVKPILPLLGNVQAVIQTDDEISTNDAEVQTQQEQAKASESGEMLRQFSAKIDLVKTKDDLKAVGKEISADAKKKMLPAHVTDLRNRYMVVEAKLNGIGPVYNTELTPEPKET